MIEKREDNALNQRFAAGQFGAHRESIVTRREDLQVQEAPIDQHEEDQYIPNYDQNMQEIWEEVEYFIQNITSGQNTPATIIAYLESFVEVSKIFGVDKCETLISQCHNCFNSFKDWKVKIQVIKTLAGIGQRIGLKKVADLVFPLVEQLLEDPEDLVILEAIKTINFLIELKVVTK